MQSKIEALEKVHSEILVCQKCELCKNRTKAVPGEGPIDAKTFFVGEGPGEKEDQEGRPFVGAAGKLLEQLLESIGLKRSDVFITNIVKCRPPNNRAPRQAEIEACNWYMKAQVGLIDPRIICPLGTPAIRTVMGPEYSATLVHGQPFGSGQRIVLPMYHPAAALYDPGLKDQLLRDFKVLKDLLEGRFSEYQWRPLGPMGAQPTQAQEPPLKQWFE